MAFIDDQISAMEERLRELQPALDEADLIRRSIANLKKEQAKAKTAPPKSKTSAKDEKPSSFHFFFVPGYTSLEERKKQVAQILEQDKHMTNQAVGDVLGISAARVSQIRKALADQ